MKSEYDFSKGVRGKFFKENISLNIPIYLEPDVQEFVDALAKNKNINVQDLTNQIIKSSIQFYKTLL